MGKFLKPIFQTESDMTKVLRLGLLFAVLAACFARAEEPTPPDTAIPDEHSFTVACLTPKGVEKPSKDEPPGGIYHYNVYLPRGYSASPERKYPCIFIASPGGNAGMGNMAARLKRDRWVVIMLVESKNATPIWYQNFLAAHDDAMKRFRIVENCKFTTGMSGGARCASMQVAYRPGFRGVILQAAGFFDDRAEKYPGDNPDTVYSATFGSTDMNLSESTIIRIRISPATYRNVEVFEGGHNWCPADLFERALEWEERKIILDAKYDKKLAEVYLWYFENQKSLYENAASDFEKCEKLELLLDLPGKLKLTADAADAATLAGWTDKLKELKASEAVTKELEARKEYLKVQEEYESYFCGGNSKNYRQWNKLVSGKSGKKGKKDDTAAAHPLKAMADKYTKVAEKYPDLVYGKLAAVRAKALTMESTAKNKTGYPSFSGGK